MMKVEMKSLASAEVLARSDADLKKVIEEGEGKMKAVKTVSGKDVDNVIRSEGRDEEPRLRRSAGAQRRGSKEGHRGRRGQDEGCQNRLREGRRQRHQIGRSR